MVKIIDSLLEEYKNYNDPYGKIRRDVKNNLIFPIVRGLYETDDKTSGLLLSSVIYGQSYISFDYALSYHGLIPEKVFLYTNVTFNKRRSKMFETKFGNYSYRDVPKAVYPYEIESILYDNYVVFMAKPEKALLDKLYTISPVSNKKKLKKLLFESLRIDEDRFASLDKELMIKLIPKYKSTNLNILKRLIEKEISKK